MKKIFSLSLLSFVLLSLMISPGLSQKAPDILEKMIEAQGGKKLLESIKDTTLSGSTEMIQMAMEGSMIMYQKEPNKMRVDVEMMGMVFTMAYDGETAWTTNLETGNAEELPEKAAEEFKREAFGNEALLHPEKLGITYASKGKEKIEDKEYFVLEQNFSDGHKMTHYVDSETYLTYKTKTTTFDPLTGLEVEAEVLTTDYKKVDGVVIPHSITTFQDQEEFMIMTIIEVKLNTGLEDSMFKMGE